MLQFTLRFPDLDKQITKLQGFERVFGQEARKLGKQTSILMRRGWRGVAAYETGHYRQSIDTRVEDIAKTHVQAIAETDVRSSKGFPYPRALEESTRYHYRSTSRVGRRTAGQVTRVFKGLKGTFEKLQERMTETIINKLVVD